MLTPFLPIFLLLISSQLNLCVPAEQIKDTVDLFSRPDFRRLRLKFLAHHLLNRRIQEETHDSVEDSHTALALYRKYEELVAAGALDQTIDYLYEVGRLNNFQV